MGKNVIVSIFFKNIIPLSNIEEMYPNDYREKRCKFNIGEVKKFEVKKRSDEEIITVLTLWFKNPKEDPRCGSSLEETFYWNARYLDCHSEWYGPPTNQLFFPKEQAQKARRNCQLSAIRGSGCHTR